MSLDIFHGNFPWKFSMDISPGQYPLTVSLDIILGQFPWTVSMDSIPGQCPWTLSLDSIPGQHPWHVMLWREGSVVSNMVRVFYRKNSHVVVILRMSTAYTRTLEVTQKGEKEGISKSSTSTDNRHTNTKEPVSLSLDKDVIFLMPDFINRKVNGLL